MGYIQGHIEKLLYASNVPTLSGSLIVVWGSLVIEKKLPVIVGAAVAVLMAIVAYALTSNLVQQRRLHAHETAEFFSHRLVSQLNESLGANYLIGAAVDGKGENIVGFEGLAAELVPEYPLLRALELAPAGVITHVYPQRGNELVVGHDLLTDKTRSKEVHRAVAQRKLAIAGPLELRQGGIGVVARLPLYRPAGDGRTRFWGFAISVIDVPTLLQAADVLALDRQGYLYQLCWIPSGDVACRLPVGDMALNPDEAIASSFSVSHAEWRLLIQPRYGWISPWEWTFMIIGVILVTLLAAIGTQYVLANRSPDDLETDKLSSPAGR